MAYKSVNGKMRLKSRSQLPEPECLIEVKRKDGTVGYEPSCISVPQTGGDSAPILTLDVKTVTEMLGVFFDPVGNGIPHITVMRDKGVVWADRLQTCPLPISGVCLSFFLQLYQVSLMVLPQWLSNLKNWMP